MTAPRRHVHEVDVVRVLTFAAVIGVHTVSEANGSQSVAANAVVMLLHFTRAAFFMLTGFVLTYQYAGRTVPLRRFWSRRLLTVGIPYLTWTVVYSGLHWYQGPRTMTFASWLDQTLLYAADGTAWFHMYFLLVSMQIYLLFPVILRLVQAARRHVVALLAVSAAAQLGLDAALTYAHPTHGALALYAREATVLVTTYQFYVLLGAVVALHFDEVIAWLRRSTKQVLVVGAAMAAVCEVVYVLGLAHNPTAAQSADVLAPIVVPWSVAITAVLLVIGVAWSDRRRSGSRLDVLLAAASDRSFGIYLSHPLVLFAVFWAAGRWLPHHLHGVPLTVGAYVLTVAGAVAVTEVFRRTPMSLALTGRDRMRRPRPASDRPATRLTPVPNIRRRNHHADDTADPSGARAQAAQCGAHDGDRHRPADPLLPGPDLQLQ
jgi:peptidoglycan/LPS O-acetylase OafA/YrhL